MGGIGITPYAAGQFTTFDLPAYAEQALVGANTFALAYGAKSVTDTRSELGIRTDKSYAMQDAILTLRGRARLGARLTIRTASIARDVPDAARRKLRRQRRGAGVRLRADHGFGRNEMDQRLVRRRHLRRRVLQRHPQLCRQGRGAIHLVRARAFSSEVDTGSREENASK